MLDAEAIKTAVLWACTSEVSSPKPGNVNTLNAIDAMSVNDFILSAEAIAPVMADPSLSVGQKILSSVKATRNTVNTNTNLGIILLFAPICQAIRQCKTHNQLPLQIAKVLDQLTIEDADLCYQAIRIAQPGGMGQSQEQDIAHPPTISLKQVMWLARDYDRIAAQYSHDYRDIFMLGLPQLGAAINCGETIEWACAFAYLKMLSVMPDSLIQRKYGLAKAKSVMKQSKIIITRIDSNKTLSDFEHTLISWDKTLKREAVNPGTTADLTAATLLIYALYQTRIYTDVNER